MQLQREEKLSEKEKEFKETTEILNL